MGTLKFAALSTALAVAMAAAPGHAQNLVTNGSFEQPKQASGGFTDFVVGSSGITGWTIVGAAGTNVTVVDENFSGNFPPYVFPAQSGTQWLDLAGFTDNAMNGVQQSIATTVGESYQLSFWVGNVLGGAFFGTQTQINAEFSSGGSNFSCVNTAQTTTTTWLNCTQTFVATNASTTFTLRSADPPSDFAAMVDNVSFMRLEIPEPTTWALLIMGMGLTGYAMRRQRRRPRDLHV